MSSFVSLGLSLEPVQSVLLRENSVEHNVFVFVYPIIIWDWDRIIGVDEGVSISRGRPWVFPDASFGNGVSRLVMVSVR